jgi:hypothetical protein
LLSLRLPRRCDLEALADILPWTDTALLVLHGRAGFQRVAHFLTRCPVNHLHLDLRTQLGERALLEVLAELPQSACLRTLSIHWPLGLARRVAGGEPTPPTAAVSAGFLAALLGELPLGRRLSHLASSRPLGGEQVRVIRRSGVEPVHFEDRLWMHQQRPLVFKASRDVPPAPSSPSSTP